MTDQPYIDPNSGAASQPGGYVTPGYTEPVEEQTPEEVVASQVQDDPSGQEAVDPDATGDEGDETPDEADAGDDETAERTGEVTDGTGETIATESDAQGQVASTTPGEGVVNEDTTPSVAPEPNEEQTATPAYNPSEHSVAEVLAYIKENPSEKDAIIEAEKADKNRSTIVGA